MLFVFCLIALLPAILVFVVDPYQYFRKSIFTPMKFLQAGQWGRMQAPGLIKNYIVEDQVFDSIVMGGSLSQNFEGDKIGSVLESDKKAIVMSFSGATPKEQTYVARKALETGNIKSIMWSFAPTWSNGLEVENQRHTFPFYLYNENPVDDINYLYGARSIKITLSYVLRQIGLHRYAYIYRNLGLPSGRIVSWKAFGSWAPFDEERMAKVNARLFSERTQKKQNRRLDNASEYYKNGMRIIPDYQDLPDDAFASEFSVLEEFFEEFPDVDFTLVVPPLSTLFYHASPQEMMERAVYRGKALVDFTKGMPNVRVFGFPEREIITDLRNYKDAVHFGRNVYRYMTKKMERNENLLTPENVDQYTSDLIKAIHEFDRENAFQYPDHPMKIDFEGNTI
jgi:hypothetical protein